MGKHDHASCEHDLAWCRHCDVTYCKHCDITWTRPIRWTVNQGVSQIPGVFYNQNATATAVIDPLRILPADLPPRQPRIGEPEIRPGIQTLGAHAHGGAGDGGG